MRAIFVLTIVMLVVAACNAGCNDVIGIPEVGHLPADAGTVDVGTVDAVVCSAGEKACSSRCVSLVSPATGCAAPETCQPCELAHGTALCVSGACALQTCELGYADCNNLASDGCEVHIATDVANCGGCGVACVDGTCNQGSCTCGGNVCGPGVPCSAGGCGN